MITLLKKTVNKILKNIEQAAVSSTCLHEIGLSPIDMNYLLPMPYSGCWELQYFTTVHQIKESETAEIQ